MGRYDLLFCEMPLPDAELGPEAVFCTRTFDGVLNNLYRITADRRLSGPVEQVLSYQNRASEHSRACVTADYRAMGPPLA